MLIYKHQTGNQLKAASSTGTTPVSTEAPKNPTNKTGLEWAKDKYKHRQPSNWNMLMMDKDGSYKDSGVNPFELMLATPSNIAKVTKLTPKSEELISKLSDRKDKLIDLENKVTRNKFLSGEKSASDLEYKITKTPAMSYNHKGTEYNMINLQKINRFGL